ncbi:MAG: ABC transporter substrate-binding protein [Bacteroidales bacterium]|nr:ABC transporter substrate-binding protein [Bacteroidales bacterium]
MRKFAILLCLLPLACCTRKVGNTGPLENYAAYFTLVDGGGVVTVSPYDGSRDTLLIDRPLDNIVCMSSSYIGFLSALKASGSVSGVSGIAYVSDSTVLAGYREGRVRDVGYDGAPDYERILSLHPDLVVTYTVSEGATPFISRLRSLGLPVLTVHEHLEDHPLARAEYIRLFGALTGRLDRADSIFAEVCRRYDSLSVKAAEPVKVLMNIPYADQWFIPGGRNYMSRLVRDAGGEVLGSESESVTSSIISVEQALLLSREADVWLNTGWCNSRAELLAANPAFKGFDIPVVANNTLRATPGGGNDFWESGPVRPDLILGDLRRIFALAGKDNQKADDLKERPLEYYLIVR